jgi:hypothetical protein
VHALLQKSAGQIKKKCQAARKGKAEQRLDLVLFRQQKLARKLLNGLAPGKKTPAQRLTLQAYRPFNPVYEAFSAHRE